MGVIVEEYGDRCIGVIVHSKELVHCNTVNYRAMVVNM